MCVGLRLPSFGSNEPTRRKGIVDTYVEPKFRTVKLRAALAVGTAAVAGAFGMGYVFAQTLDGSTRATLSARGAAADHAFSHALAESLVLKNRSAVEGKAADIRYRRVIAP
jgi:hypothetical protein